MKLVKAFCLFIVLFACKEKQELVEPECLLSETELINVMVDVSLVRSAKSLGRKELKDSGIKPLEYLFAKHGVDTITIRENLEYYNTDLKKSKELYTRVVDTLKMRQELLEAYIDSLPSSKKEKEKKKLLEEENDSLSDSKNKNKKEKLVKKIVDPLPDSKKEKLLEEKNDSLPIPEEQKEEGILLEEIIHWLPIPRSKDLEKVLSEEETSLLLCPEDENQEIVKED